MTITLGGSVGLLDQALGYTCGHLSAVRDDLLDRPTPCAGWDLADLLAHMEDALDAFTEAAGGAVGVRNARTGTAPVTPVAAIQAKAVALRDAWAGPAPGDVVLEASQGRVDLVAPLLVATAALEVVVHGWDVGQATGCPDPLPERLAHELLPVARVVVGPADRGARFAAPRPVPADATDGQRLLAHVGRTT